MRGGRPETRPLHLAFGRLHMHGSWAELASNVETASTYSARLLRLVILSSLPPLPLFHSLSFTAMWHVGGAVSNSSQ